MSEGTYISLDDPGDLLRLDFLKDPYGLPAVCQGVHLIASELASLPIHVYNGPLHALDSPVEADDSVMRLLNGQWNENEDAYRAKMRVVKTVIDHGRCFVYVSRNERNRPVGLYPLDPKLVVQHKSTDGYKYLYEYTGEGSLRGVLPREDLAIVDYMPNTTGADSVAPLKQVAESINAALAAQAYAENQFASGGVGPVAVLAKATETTGAARQEALSKSLKNMANRGDRVLYVGDSEAKLVVLGQGPEAMRLVENRTFGVQEVARVLGIDPALLGDKSQGAFSTTEAAATQFVRFTLRPWAARIGLALTNAMFPGHRRWLRLDTDHAARGETLERIRAGAAAIQTGQLTPDEARQDLGYAPMGGAADQLWAQGALQPLERLAKEPEPQPIVMAPQDDNLNPQEPLGGDPGADVDREEPEE